MMRNASSFVILFPVTNQLNFLKEASKSNPFFVHQHLPDLSTKISYYAHNIVNWMAPKSDCRWSERTPIQSITPSHLSMHPFQGHHLYNQPFRIQTRIILPLIECTSISHSPFLAYLPYPMISIEVMKPHPNQITNSYPKFGKFIH